MHRPQSLPSAKDAATKTDVLRRIISMYSSTVTSLRVSKAMSLCWPKHTSRAVWLKSFNAAGKSGRWQLRQRHVGQRVHRVTR